MSNPVYYILNMNLLPLFGDSIYSVINYLQCVLKGHCFLLLSAGQ